MAKHRFKRFRELQPEDFLVDLHVHSRWSDGFLTVPELAAAAVSADMRCIAITDHVSLSSKYCGDLALEVALASREHGIPILAGFEASICNFDGELELPAEACELADLVIGSVHGIPLGSGILEIGGMPYQELAHLEEKLCLALLSSGKADVLGHCCGLCMNRHKRIEKESMERIIEVCAGSSTAFEISSKYHAPIMGELMSLLAKYNPFISIGSDAHGLQDLGACGALLRKNWNSWSGLVPCNA